MHNFPRPTQERLFDVRNIKKGCKSKRKKEERGKQDGRKAIENLNIL